MSRLQPLFILLVLFMGSVSYSAALLSAKSDAVKVLAQPSKTAPVLIKLAKGDVLESLERKGLFWKVKTDTGTIGYVAFSDVSRQAEDASSLAQAIRNAALESRDMDKVKSARARSSVMGIRGLDESEETASAGSVRPNLRLVYDMEDRIPKREEIDRIANLVQAESLKKTEK